MNKPPCLPSASWEEDGPPPPGQLPSAAPEQVLLRCIFLEPRVALCAVCAPSSLCSDGALPPCGHRAESPPPVPRLTGPAHSRYPADTWGGGEGSTRCTPVCPAAPLCTQVHACTHRHTQGKRVCTHVDTNTRRVSMCIHAAHARTGAQPCCWLPAGGRGPGPWGRFSLWVTVLRLPDYPHQQPVRRTLSAQLRALLDLSFIFYKQVFIFLGSLDSAIKCLVLRPGALRDRRFG